MAISVRVDPLLERELELAAKRQGVTKSQFIVEAIERALGRKNAYELMMSLMAEEARAGGSVKKTFKGTELPYERVASRKALVSTLKDKHRAGGVG
jgi:predicted DNA-binding protein